jgi:hypothetical protein
VKTGLTLSATAVICLAVSSGGGPCPDGFWVVGVLSGFVGWLVSFASLGTATDRSAHDVGVAALVAILLTAAIILLGNGHGWKVSEPDSWIHVAVFFVVPLTLAGVAVSRRRKAAR